MDSAYDIEDPAKRETIRNGLMLLAGIALGFNPLEAYAIQKKKLAIILDDAGADNRDMAHITQLHQHDVPINIAVLPEYRHTRHVLEALAQYHTANIILHQPMEPFRMRERGLRIEDNPNTHSGIYLTDTEAQIAYTLYNNLASCDNMLRALKSPKRVVGMNNHMGSAITADPKKMREIFIALKEYERLHGRPLIWIDSNTTAKSVSMEVARQSGIKAYKSQGFLDVTQESPKGEQALEKIVKTAKSLASGPHDVAVLIGHVKYEHTIQALLQAQKTLEQQNIPVELSTLLRC